MQFFIVKGPEIAKYYPFPAFRSMGDLDVVTKDRDTARLVLEELDFSVIIEENCDDWKCYNHSLEIELHDRLLYDSPINTERLKVFFNDSFKYVKKNKLNESFHFFLLVHAREHLMSYGIGFRQFFDIAVLIKNCKDLDWVWIEEKLRELELLNFAQIVFALIERWFGINTPLQYAPVANDFYELATENIFKGGVFGFENEDTMKNNDANKINSSKHPYIDSLKRNTSIVFPNYQEIQKDGKYTFLRDRPVLLPIAWIVRIWNAVVNNNPVVICQKIKQSFISSSYAKERKDYLALWGVEIKIHEENMSIIFIKRKWECWN